MNSDCFFIDNITGFGNFLYVATYYNDNNHIISINLKTYDTTILTNGLNRVWKLCTDGETLYAYDSTNRGRITVIDLKN
ncbi:hypothetical protein RBH29_13400 [Herbivorax sp. ANBcel31]|uniref:hypothetical protein n=1 Tax=Herbivorax sp. ANBcel31 TaxID=3069754 RepID=UPI0027B01F70|nr:hypothetical protein [Herbivorax sp. ANBcel31]MDQ2087422.1 hypothetical protein [Herbivorax sp. ANBcel31]